MFPPEKELIKAFKWQCNTFLEKEILFLTVLHVYALDFVLFFKKKTLLFYEFYHIIPGRFIHLLNVLFHVTESIRFLKKNYFLLLH